MSIYWNFAETMVDINKNLGVTVDYLRKARGLTQSQLSKVAGIPRSTLAHIESGVGNPNLQTLSKLALALGVPYEELLITPKPPCVLIRSQDLKRQSRAQGKAQKVELLPRPIPGLQFERVELQNYAMLVGTPHSKGTREYFTCVKGRISITVEGDSYALDTGDVFAFPGDRKHTYQNLEGFPSEGISIVALHFAEFDSI